MLTFSRYLQANTSCVVYEGHVMHAHVQSLVHSTETTLSVLVSREVAALVALCLRAVCWVRVDVSTGTLARVSNVVSENLRIILFAAVAWGHKSCVGAASSD